MPVGKTWAELMNEAKNAPKTEFKLLDPATYPFYVKDAKAQRDKSGTKDQILMTVAVESGERKGATVRNYLTLSPESPQALQIFFRDLANFGLTEEFFNQNPSMDIAVIANALVNRRFSAEVIHTKQGDKTYANLTNIAPPAGPAPQAGVPGGVPATTQPSGPAPGQQGYPTQAQAGYPGQPSNSGYVSPPPVASGTGNPWDQAPPAPPVLGTGNQEPWSQAPPAPPAGL